MSTAISNFTEFTQISQILSHNTIKQSLLSNKNANQYLQPSSKYQNITNPSFKQTQKSIVEGQNNQNIEKIQNNKVNKNQNMKTIQNKKQSSGNIRFIQSQIISDDRDLSLHHNQQKQSVEILSMIDGYQSRIFVPPTKNQFPIIQYSIVVSNNTKISESIILENRLISKQKYINQNSHKVSQVIKKQELKSKIKKQELKSKNFIPKYLRVERIIDMKIINNLIKMKKQMQKQQNQIQKQQKQIQKQQNIWKKICKKLFCCIF